MAWVYLDDGFPDHPKVVAAGDDAAWMFVAGLCYVRRFGTEGVIPKPQVPRLTSNRAPQKTADRLLAVGLWIDEGDVYRVHDYHEWNRPASSRSAAGRRAAEARWGKRDASETHANRNANASETHMRQDALSHPIPSLSEHPLPPNARRDAILAAAAQLELDKFVNSGGRVISKPKWCESVQQRLERDEGHRLDLLLKRFPSAPDGVLAAALLGDTHSLAHYREEAS